MMPPIVCEFEIDHYTWDYDPTLYEEYVGF